MDSCLTAEVQGAGSSTPASVTVGHTVKSSRGRHSSGEGSSHHYQGHPQLHGKSKLSRGYLRCVSEEKFWKGGGLEMQLSGQSACWACIKLWSPTPYELGMEAQAYNLSIWEVQARGPEASGHLQLHWKFKSSQGTREIKSQTISTPLAYVKGNVWMLGPQLEVPFEEVLRILGGGARLEEVGHFESYTWSQGLLPILSSALGSCLPAVPHTSSSHRTNGPRDSGLKPQTNYSSLEVHLFP